MMIGGALEEHWRAGGGAEEDGRSIGGLEDWRRVGRGCIDRFSKYFQGKSGPSYKFVGGGNIYFFSLKIGIWVDFRTFSLIFVD